MTIESFVENLKKELYRREVWQREQSGVSERRIEYHVIRKNNGVKHHGILVMEEEERIIPYIYVERYLEEYEEGRQLQDIASEIEQVWGKQREEMKNQELDFSYERIQEQIVYRLVHYKKNEEWLERVPYLPMLDLAVTFHTVLFQEEHAIGSVQLQNRHLEHWGVTAEEICRRAMENTPRLFPAEIHPLEEVLKMEPSGVPMYLISNASGLNGAAAILYPSLLSEFSEKLHTSLYLLPSSIHEFIAVPFRREYDVEGLREIVREVNENQVPEEEYLSDEVYYYDRKNAVILKL